MPEIKEYKVNVPQEKIDRLMRRIDETEFPTELDDAPEWQYGSPLSITLQLTHCVHGKDVKRFADHWRNKFDWREHERKINELPNYEVKVDIDGFGSVDMHFLHQKSEVEGAIPLLFCHGWPGSFLEVTKALPLLKGGDGKPAFHVVAPSMPNYVFSGPMLKKGFNIGRYAEAMHKVMLEMS